MNKDGIHYIKFNPHYDSNLLESLVICYQKVFADEPWNEWKKCEVCSAQWGMSDEKKLMNLDFCCCGKQVVDFWPSKVVRNDIYKEITKDASCWLALNDSNDTYYYVDDESTFERLKQLQQGLQEKAPNKIHNEFIDEISKILDLCKRVESNLEISYCPK